MNNNIIGAIMKLIKMLQNLNAIHKSFKIKSLETISFKLHLIINKFLFCINNYLWTKNISWSSRLWD